MEIKNQCENAVNELVEKAKLKAGLDAINFFDMVK